MTVFTGFVSRHHDGNVSVEEIIDSGDGVKTVFVGQSDIFPVDIDTVSIKFTPQGGSEKTVVSSNGVFSDPDITSGTITRSGSLNITFNPPLEDLTDLKFSSYDYFGMLSEIIHNVCGSRIETTLGTGDGIQTSFGTTLSGAKISKGQLWLLFKIDGSLYEVWDNGEGEFDHELISTSSIDYVTKIINVDFTQATDDGEIVQTIHSESNDGEDWVSVLEKRTVQDFNHNTEVDADNQNEVVIKNSGSSNKERIILGMREYSNAGNNVFGISLSLFQRWNHSDHVLGHYYNTTANPFPANYDVTNNETNTAIPRFIISNQTMQYWIFSSKSRIVVFVKNSGTIYTSMYVGEGRRISSNLKYDRPQIVIGNATSNTINFTSTLLFSIFNPSSNTALFFDWDGIYKQSGSSLSSAQYGFGYMSWVDTGELKKTNGKVQVDNITIVRQEGFGNNSEALFSLDGVFICPAVELSSEHTLDGGNYLVFQDIFRVDYKSFGCVEMS